MLSVSVPSLILLRFAASSHPSSSLSFFLLPLFLFHTAPEAQTYMMHQCAGGSHGNMVGSCSCGMFHSQSNSFSVFLSVPNHGAQKHFVADEAVEMEMYSNYASSPSSVDCTLSLGTPSTRLTELDEHHHEKRGVASHERRSAGSYVSNFCWDLLHPKHSLQKTSGRAGGNTAVASGDPFLARRCANCDTTSTPLWRNGPRGPKSLCNACGIRFKKEERRASAAAATVNSTAAGVAVESNHHMFGGNYKNSTWIPHHSQTTQKIPCLSPAASNNESMFMADDTRSEAENGISFLSWRLNVTDRPSLVHDFPR